MKDKVTISLDGQKYEVPKCLLKHLDTGKDKENHQVTDSKESEMKEKEKQDNVSEKIKNMSASEQKKMYDNFMKKKDEDKDEEKKKDMSEEKDKDKDKKDEDEEEEKKKDKDGVEKAIGGSQKAIDSQTVEKMVLDATKDREVAISGAREVLDSQTFDELQHKTSSDIKKAVVQKLSPNIKVDNVDKAYIDGLFEGLVNAQQGGAEVSRVLLDHARTCKTDGGQSNKEEKVDGTLFTLTNNGHGHLSNLSKAHLYDSYKDYQDACKKLRAVDLDDINIFKGAI